MSSRIAVVLAAGKGTRMDSDLPKVLCPVKGRPMIEYVLESLRQANVERILVVVGYRAELVQSALAHWEGLEFVLQAEQLGTGHAVRMCSPQLRDYAGPVVIVTGDSPLTLAESLEALFEEYEKDRPAVVMGTLHKEDPTGLGRIVRDEAGQFVAIIEQKDATPEQLAITEVNMSTYVFDCQPLLTALTDVKDDNKQGEYYVTDCPGILKAAGHKVRALPILKPCEALSVNTVEDLSRVELAMDRMQS